MVNFFKRKSDGTLNAKIVMKTASGAPLGMASNACPAVADWNGDGLFDILVGTENAADNGGGLIKLFINKGTAQKYSFEDGVLVKTSDGQVIKNYQRIRIQVVDLNYDGKLDLVMGQGWSTNASFWFFENSGTAKVPSLKQPVKLQKKDGSTITVYLDASPCFTDWNSDGGLDLIAAGKGLENGIDLYLGEKPPTPVLNSNSVKPAVRKYTLQGGHYRTELYLNNQENILFQVLSVDGRMVESVNLGSLPAGANSIRHDMNKYPTGCYVIRVRAGEKSINENRLLLFKN